MKPIYFWGIATIMSIAFYCAPFTTLIACDFSGNRQLTLEYQQIDSSEFQFRIAQIAPLEKNLTDPIANDTQTPQYRYLWDFGDCSQPSTQNTPFHRYQQAGTYTVKLTVKPVGAADNQTMTCTIDVSVLAGNSFECGNYVYPYTMYSNEYIRLQPAALLNSEGNPQNRSMLPEAGQLMLYTIQIKGGGLNTTPKVTFQFPTDALEFSVAYNTHSCAACNFASFDSYTQTGNTAQIIYQLESNIPLSQYRTIYIALLVKPTVAANTNIYCTATLDYQTGSSTPFLSQDDALSVALAPQPDNSKWADKDSLCSSISEWLTYKIKFKNNGNRTAQHICIIDSLPTYLDLTQIELLEVYPHQLPATRFNNYASCTNNTSTVFAANNAFMAIDATNRHITWELRDIALAGAQSSEAATNPDLSEGYIIYRIKANGASMPYNFVLQSRANTYFDGQWAAQTNLTTTARQAPSTCYCNLQDQTSLTSWIKKVRLYRTAGLPTPTTTYYIDNLSGNNNGYAITTNSPPTLYKNTNYRLELTPEATTGSTGGNTFSWKIWIDVDNNGFFDPINEQIFGAYCSNAAIDFAFTLPSDIPTGPNRLRIAMERGCDSNIDVCSGTNAAEIEDYIINIADYGRPDLTLTIPANADTIFAEPNSSETLQYTLQNIGTAPAYTGTLNAYYLSEDPFFDAGDKLLGLYTVGINIVDGGYLNISQPFTTPDTLTGGIYYLFIRVDKENLNDESAKYNNYNRVALFVCQDDLNCQVKSPLKVYLQGAFNSSTGMLTTTLAANLQLPIQQPYFGAPHYYSGNENTALLTNINSSDLCDWVLVELRDAANNTRIRAQKAALLHSNGQITDVGSNTLSFYTDAGSYYIVVYHRNHLGIMSASPVNLSATTTSIYNFTDTPFKAFGSGSQTANLGSGKYGLLVGDINQDGVISKADSDKWQQQTTTTNTYKSADLNMDTTINTSDFGLLRPNMHRLSPYFLRK